MTHFIYLFYLESLSLPSLDKRIKSACSHFATEKERKERKNTTGKKQGGGGEEKVTLQSKNKIVIILVGLIV